MAKCYQCGAEFSLSSARKSIGQQFGAGSYNDNFPDGDVCEECAFEELSAAMATWRELQSLMGDDD